MIFADVKPFVKHSERKFDDTAGHPADVAVVYQTVVSLASVLKQDSTCYMIRPQSEQDSALICAVTGSAGLSYKNEDGTVTVYDAKLNG